ncbi:MAG: hypothetical protein CLLPBCKN_008262 [Chroococcidiopsis cubana SAG 39.79]|nr:hypothetical protein [Chroococcidiopsis cubana]MDZ4878824.1 hypothetical protein [Chroococcidiopsis cubana SAG 39.79]
MNVNIYRQSKADGRRQKEKSVRWAMPTLRMKENIFNYSGSPQI